MNADRVGPRVLMFAALSSFGCGMARERRYYSIALGVAVIGLFGGLACTQVMQRGRRIWRAFRRNDGRETWSGRVREMA